MDDLISRQSAIDTLDVCAELFRRVLDDADIVGAAREKYEWGLGLIESCISDIKELPFAELNLLWRNAYKQGKADAESDRVSPGNIVINEQGKLKYCPVCGSRMKGEDE